MRTPIFRPGLITILLFALAACTVADLEPPESADDVFGKPRPEFPSTEYAEGREGWVLAGFVVGRSGLVQDVGILDSSGSEAFEQAALETLQHWRFEPGEPGHKTGMVNFVFEDTVVQLSRRFISLNTEVHDLIETGDLDAAEALLAEIHGDELSAFELAYASLTAGRIAGERGDLARQLALFRRAAQSEGLWLGRDKYLATLRAIVIMEIEQQDYVSAVRDFELLTETSVGEKMGSDLEDTIDSIREYIETQGIAGEPFILADTTVAVVRDNPTFNASTVKEQVHRASRSQPAAKPGKRN